MGVTEDNGFCCVEVLVSLSVSAGCFYVVGMLRCSSEMSGETE